MTSLASAPCSPCRMDEIDQRADWFAKRMCCSGESFSPSFVEKIGKKSSGRIWCVAVSNGSVKSHSHRGLAALATRLEERP